MLKRIDFTKKEQSLQLDNYLFRVLINCTKNLYVYASTLKKFTAFLEWYDFFQDPQDIISQIMRRAPSEMEDVIDSSPLSCSRMNWKSSLHFRLVFILLVPFASLLLLLWVIWIFFLLILTKFYSYWFLHVLIWKVSSVVCTTTIQKETKRETANDMMFECFEYLFHTWTLNLWHRYQIFSLVSWNPCFMKLKFNLLMIFPDIYCSYSKDKVRYTSTLHPLSTLVQVSLNGWISVSENC